MPMLMTLRMRLPVWPFHSPLRTRLEKPAILSSTAWTWGTTFSPSTTIDDPCGARRATCSTARFSVTLIFSPRNMASMRDCRPDSSASPKRSFSVSSVGRAPALRMRCQRGESSRSRYALYVRLAMAIPSRSRSAGLGPLVEAADVPAAHEQRSDRTDVGFQTGGDAPLDAPQVRPGGRQVVLPGEQQRHVDRHAREDGLLDGGEAHLACRGS